MLRGLTARERYATWLREWRERPGPLHPARQLQLDALWEAIDDGDLPLVELWQSELAAPLPERFVVEVTVGERSRPLPERGQPHPLRDPSVERKTPHGAYARRRAQ